MTNSCQCWVPALTYILLSVKSYVEMRSSCDNLTELSFLFCAHGAPGRPLQAGIVTDSLVVHAAPTSV